MGKGEGRELLGCDAWTCSGSALKTWVLMLADAEGICHAHCQATADQICVLRKTNISTCNLYSMKPHHYLCLSILRTPRPTQPLYYPYLCMMKVSQASRSDSTQSGMRRNASGPPPGSPEPLGVGGDRATCTSQATCAGIEGSVQMHAGWEVHICSHQVLQLEACCMPQLQQWPTTQTLVVWNVYC
jgi:hypothetical protein